MTTRRGAGSRTGVLIVLSACTEFAPASDVEAPELSPSDLSLSGNADWGCLADARASAPSLSDLEGAPRAVRSLRVAGFVGGPAMADTRVRACSVRDPECQSPVTPWLNPDADGWVDLPLYAGFDGYLEITGTGAVPVMLFYSTPLETTTTLDADPEFLVDQETASSFDRLFLGRDAFPTAAVITLRAWNCQNSPASGVRFTLEPTGVGWYYVGDIPVGTAQATTESGVGGFSDVRPGTAVVTAALAEGGIELAPPQSVFVRSGWFTNIRFRR